MTNYAGIEVTVTMSDIRRGKPHLTCSCPVALAMKRALGKRKGINVWLDELAISDIHYAAPARVGRFVRKFDAAKSGGYFALADFKPFTFKIGRALSVEAKPR